MSKVKVNLKPKNSRARIVFNALLILLLLILIIPPMVGKIKKQSTEKQLPFTESFVDKNNYAIKSTSPVLIVEKVSKSVVSIVTNSEHRGYFGNHTQSGAGSGALLSKNGYIITNKHVVKRSSNIKVIDYKGEVYDEVELIATDPLNDIAFLKIKSDKEFHPIELGDSKTLKVGQSVLAIGNALGLYQNTVTAGIISGVGRSIVASSSQLDSERLNDLIQTDAAINPGNSGGPLVNAGGQMIGINTAIAAQANNTGFAIPIGAAKGMIKQLLANKKVERSYIGIRYQPVDPTLAKQRKLSVKSGALITENGISNNSPAIKAGLKDGDVIIKINQNEVGKQGSLSSLVSEYSVGETIKLTIMRDKKQLVKNLTLIAFN